MAETLRRLIRRVAFFFPIQLFFLHLKSSMLLLIIWAILFGFVTKAIGLKYGIPYLFLFPEYLGEVNIWSHMIVGFALGGFIIAFNMYSYVMHGHLFPFIATLSRPFWKFSVNNSLIPLLFLVVYIWQASSFQYSRELLGGGEVVLNMMGFVLGVALFIMLAFFYFFRTNKDIRRLGIKPPKEGDPVEGVKGNVLHKRRAWFTPGAKTWRVLTYMAHPFKIKLARDCRHYDEDILHQIFSQNQINASYFEIVLIVTFVILGTFQETPFFMIPAGASFILVFTIILMLVSAFYSWFRGWTFSVILGLAILLNYGSEHFSFMQMQNRVYGLDYSYKVSYTAGALRELRDYPENYDADIRHHEAILNRWKSKNTGYAKMVGLVKPKLVIVASSGGGLRAAMWTTHTMQMLDSATDGQFLEHTHLITGSSGGMIGASYLRELKLRSLTDSVNLYDRKYAENISQDILNPIGFSIATNDIFVRYRTFEYNNVNYTKDRAYAFEKQLHQNTGGIMEKRLADYAEPEANAEIPLMVFSPSVVNDGRRFIISPQPISFLSNNKPDPSLSLMPNVEDIEFRRFFAAQMADSIRFSSVMRMSATFPYILPIVSLPTEPKVEVMDAGLRDNFGLNTVVHYLYSMRNWIEKNTSGVIIVQIRDTYKHFEVDDKEINSIADRLLAPAGSMYTNFTKVQDYGHDQLLQYTSSWMKKPLDVVVFELPNSRENHVSLSWHLSRFEKARILKAIKLESNQMAMRRLQELLLTERHRVNQNSGG